VQAALRPAPEFSFDLENVAGSGEAAGTDAAEATFALSQVIELGNKRDARIGAAQASRSVLAIEHDALQIDVLAEVTRRFITVAEREQQLTLARSAVDLAEKVVAATERRVDAAKAPHAEEDRARIALDRTRLEERGALVALDTARRQLAATWGESQASIDGQPFGAVQADLFATPPAGDFSTLITSLAANPEFLRFASEARLRDAELRLAQSQRKPDVTLSAGLRHLEAADDQAFVVSMSMPLFSERRSSGVVAEAQANRERVDADRRVAEVTVQATLYELHQQLSRSIEDVRALKDDIRPRSAEALSETQRAYERGRYSYLELVDAQREYLAVQAALIAAAANAHLLRVEIERLTNSPVSSTTL
jgi:cobalt-zinc-cadmium efflux system outer membrane protein